MSDDLVRRPNLPIIMTTAPVPQVLCAESRRERELEKERQCRLISLERYRDQLTGPIN